MNKEEYQENRVRRGKRDAGNNVDGLGDPYRVRWHFALVTTVVSGVLLFLWDNKKHLGLKRNKLYLMGTLSHNKAPCEFYVLT